MRRRIESKYNALCQIVDLFEIEIDGAYSFKNPCPKLDLCVFVFRELQTD